MFDSLKSGEDTFHLQDAQSLRSSIAQQAEVLDVISKQIVATATESDQPKVLLLQNAIRRATTQYIKEYLLVLPSPMDLDKMRKGRVKTHSQNFEQPNSLHVVKVAVTTGWSPENVNIEQNLPEISNDPLMQQINIVRNYIRQARLANRYEEVASLEENLKFLKHTYQLRQVHSDIASS